MNKDTRTSLQTNENMDAVDAVDAVPNYKTEWSTPTPLYSMTLPPAMQMTDEMLPRGIKPAVLNHAMRLNHTSPDFTAVGLITSMAALVGGSIEIKPKSNDPWTVCPIFFSCVVGNASSMKTPSLELGIQQLQRVQENYSEQFNDRQMIEYEIKTQIYHEHEKSLKASLKSAYQSGDTESINSIMKELNSIEKPKKPFRRNIYISDCTVEALCLRLSENPAGVLYFRDEFAGWLTSIEQKGREHERPFFLEAFNGSKSKYIQERIGRENVILERRIVNLLGGIQPKLLAPLVKQKITGVKDDGLLERILLFSVFPEPSEIQHSDVSKDYEAEFKLTEIFNALGQLHRPFDRLVFTFESDAQIVWNSWSIETIEEQIHIPEELQSLWIKRPATCAKLALIFHMIEQAEQHARINASKPFEPYLKVSKDSLNKALIWMKYLKSHTKKIFALANNQCGSVAAASLISKLNKLPPKFTKQQLSQKNWKDLTSADSREEALNMLEKAGYIKLVEQPNRHYIVHPDYTIQKAA
ncbi:DUF3987 domain-containing protein [Vibrio parahaemolyticus]|uniref:DUF3987 domain-containing protein n=1 Tax=Vibrio parahaemolyticus TaxID=670 RepID=UPI00101FD456|nr:DUF3987 domain-containing protein [Vibrio parahaemolyticus]